MIGEVKPTDVAKLAIEILGLPHHDDWAVTVAAMEWLAGRVVSAEPLDVRRRRKDETATAMALAAAHAALAFGHPERARGIFDALWRPS